MTDNHEARQYITVSVGGRGEHVTLALPEK